MNEKKLLAASANSRKAWELLTAHVEDGDFTETGRRILSALGDYYTRDPAAKAVDRETFDGLVLQNVKIEKHRETFKLALEKLWQVDVSPLNVASLVLSAKRDAVLARLSTASVAQESPETILPLMEEYSALCKADALEGGPKGPEVFRGLTLREIYGETGKEELVQVLPIPLNVRLGGGLLRGNHLIVAARPEMGKTAFLVNMCFGFLKQRLKVVYFINEEGPRHIQPRMISRLVNKTPEECRKDIDAVDAEAKAKGLDNFVVVDLQPGTLAEIEAIVEEEKPDVIILDQLRNIMVKREDNFTRQLEKVAIGARQIGRRHNCVVISATQAGGSAEGKAVLDMGDIDSSNTGIPAQADVLLGIGADKDDQASNRRVLSLIKNKRSGNHEFFPVRLIPQLNKYMGLGD